MKKETEVLLVAALDRMITQVDNAIDELLDLDAPEARKAETILLTITMELNGLLDRIAEDHEEEHPRSGAV